MHYPPEEQPGVAGDLPETLQASHYLQEEQPGVAGDLSQTVQGSCYLQEEQPGVAGDLSQTVQGSCYPETKPVDYSFHEEGKKKKTTFKSLNKTIM